MGFACQWPKVYWPCSMGRAHCMGFDFCFVFFLKGVNMKNDHTILVSVVDELATIKAQLATLAKREAELKEILVSSGLASIDGTLHKVSISHVSGRVVTDWRTVAEKLAPSRQLVQAHTTQGAGYVAVKIFSRG
jgi:hypothetical protein